MIRVPRSISRSATEFSFWLIGAVLFIWGVISFHNLPIEAYPDVADTMSR